MTNKYLEKIALNRLEQHLSQQPWDREYSNRGIQRLHDKVHVQVSNPEYTNLHKAIEVQAKKIEEGTGKSLLKYKASGTPLGMIRRIRAVMK